MTSLHGAAETQRLAQTSGQVAGAEELAATPRSVDPRPPCQGPGRGAAWREVPEIVPPAELAAQLVVEAPPHLAQPAPAEVTAEAVLMPVLVDGLQEVAVPNVLLAAAACQQGRGDLQHLIHWLPGKKTPH